MVDEAAETPGDRLYLIRLARGDGRRRAESLVVFVRHVLAVTGEKYHPTTVSMLERNQQTWRLDDVRAFAAVDPLRRGEVWLSALSDAEERAQRTVDAPEEITGPGRDTQVGGFPPTPAPKQARGGSRRRHG